jgi:exonuclease SbcC
MRILQIRFKNLNSLVGEWSIDLTQPQYLSDGLFAITGPTGAGKSTILDAICLGLYGSTPRLGRITKSANDIMSRHTGECFAQITFETQHGKFESTWSQHRARKKADGELQNPQHKLINLSTEQTIAEKLTEVGREIENATGLDFERFTRSILLAQGSFAAFLHANSDDRAPILEQITGTQIYSEISIKVHERAALERKNLVQLQSQLKALKLLDAQEEQQLHEQLAQHQTDSSLLTQQIKTTELALQWRQQLNALEQDLINLEADQIALAHQQQAFEPQQIRLQQALKALELASDYQAVTLHRTLRAKHITQQSTLEQQLPTAETAAQQAQALLKKAQTDWQAAKDHYQNQQPIFITVRKIDNDLEHHHTEMAKLQTQLAEQQTKYSNTYNEQTELVKKCSHQQQALDQVLDYLSTHATDAALVGELAGLQERFKHLQAQQGTVKAQYTEYLTNQIQQQDLEKNLQQTAQAFQQNTELLTKLNQEFTATQQQLDTYLQGKVLSTWHSEASTLKEQVQHLEQLQSTLANRAELEQVLEELQQSTQDYEAQAQQLQYLIEVKQAQHETYNQDVNHLTQRQRLEAVIQSFEQHRAALQEGEACPLCGALEHPFAQGNLPIQSDTDKQLDTAKQLVKHSTEAIHKLQRQETQIQTTVEKQIEQARTYQAQLESMTQTISNWRLPLKLQSTHLSAEYLSDLILSTQAQWQTIQSIIQQAEGAESTLKQFSTQLAQAQSTYQTAKDQHQHADFTFKACNQTLSELKTKYLKLEQQLQSELIETSTLIAQFDREALSLETLVQTEQILTKRRADWLEYSEQKIQLTKVLDQWHQQHSTLQERLNIIQLDIENLIKQLEQQQTEYSTLKNNRFELLGNQVVATVEQQLTNTIQQAEIQLQSTREAQQTAQQNLSTLQTQHTKVLQDITSTSEKLIELEQTFMARLQQTEFTSEAEYQAAALPENERQRLHQNSQTLQRTATELATKQQDKKLQLVALQAKQLSESSADVLQTQGSELQTKLADVLRQIGSVQHQLDRHQDIKLEQEQQIQAIESQRKESARWDILYTLIGSADGKKYRNFAQGLTFEIMIHHANKQLCKMSERYLLVRHKDQPLELNVIDTYQAGEIRSTRNLSGGESFLLSLALALGLSHMASQNVRVDSLFLDEGFGTLDQEALDTALETLSNLQQEGKLIGIISHVQALQERISTQICVRPQTGGRSTLHGIGCEPIINPPIIA